jgi:glycosyltransferase involved in cell wall biosynthesis
MIVEEEKVRIVSNFELDSQNKFNLQVKPKISFIVLSFNNAKYINETLKSVASQTLRNIEIIITDDGSQDGSQDIISNFVNSCTLPCIGILWHQNGGIVRSYNYALKFSSSDIVAHIASDDINHEERLMLQLDSLLESSASMCIAGLEVIDEKSRKLWESHVPKDAQSLNFVVQKNMMYGSSPTMMYRKKLIDSFGPLPNDLANEDEALYFRALCTGGILVLDRCLVSYRLHEGSVTARSRIMSLIKYVRWMASDLKNQLANKNHWIFVLNATSNYEMIPAANAIIQKIKEKQNFLDTISNKIFLIILIRLISNIYGREIICKYILQQFKLVRFNFKRIITAIRTL